MAGYVLVIIAVITQLLLPTFGQQGLTLSLRNRSIAAGSDVIVTDIGENVDGAALICTTDLPDCCNTAAGGYKRGNWIHRNTSNAVGRRTDDGDFYVIRTAQRQIILNRKHSRVSQGTYCCEVTTTASPGHDEAICINLVVSHPLTVMLSGSDPQTAGESYTLTCTASSGSTPSYQWTKDGALVTASSKIFFSQVSQSFRNISQTLTISPLTQADTGEYTCTVKRGNMSALRSISLDIRDNPDHTVAIFSGVLAIIAATTIITVILLTICWRIKCSQLRASIRAKEPDINEVTDSHGKRPSQPTGDMSVKTDEKFSWRSVQYMNRKEWMKLFTTT